MRLLLDTQLALWWQMGDARLERGGRRLIEEWDDSVLVSRASLWELAIKASIGRLNFDVSVFAYQVEAMGFAWLSIENRHILQLAQLPLFADHRDPFDRLLVAQSDSESLTFATADAQLARYGDRVRIV